MPITGLSDRRQGFPPIGELRKGSPKRTNQSGRETFGTDLGESFRFTSRDPAVTAAFSRLYGDQPQRVTALLVGAHTDDVFDAWNEIYSAGGLVHRCDGERLVWARDRQFSKDGTGDTRRWAVGQGPPCAYARVALDAKDESGKPVNRCRPHGRLKILPVVVDDLGRVQMADLGRVGSVLVLTTAINDIVRIGQTLRMYEAMNGSLSGIPFVLSRSAETVTRPGKDGARVREDRWLIDLTPDRAWLSHQLEASRRAQFAAGAAPAVADVATRLALPPRPRVVDEDGVIHDGTTLEEVPAYEPEDDWVDDVKSPAEIGAERAASIGPPPPPAPDDSPVLAGDPIWQDWARVLELAKQYSITVHDPPSGVTYGALRRTIRAIQMRHEKATQMRDSRPAGVA